MSGTLPKSPSEGDLTSNSVEFPHTLNKRKSLSRSFLPLGTNKFYLPPDLKKGAFASSNIRIVWKSATYGDLSNLNKVLDLPPVPKRSPSPITPKVGPTDHVFSEYFDPLAVHKREYVESSEEEDPENKSVSSSFHRPVDRKRLDTDIEEIDMPSVKVLKSLFEKSKEEKSKDVPHFTRTSKKLKPNLEKNVTTLKDEPKDLDTDKDNTEIKVRETKENVKNLSLIIINEKEKPISKENKKDEGHPNEHNIHESEKLKSTETKVKISSKDINIEADHIRKVKDLLSIFKRMESRKEVSSTVNDSSTEKAIPETSSKIVEKDVEIVDSDKEKTISSERIVIKEVFPGDEKVKAKESSSTTEKTKLSTQDLEDKYRSEAPIDTSSTSVFDLKRKWETLVIRKEKPSENVESTDKIQKHDKTEDDKDKKPATEKDNKMSTENLSQPKIIIEKKASSTEKEKSNIEKTETEKEKVILITTRKHSGEKKTNIDKAETEKEKTILITTRKHSGEKGKVTIEENVFEKEKELPKKKELQKTYSDSVYDTKYSQNIVITERKNEVRTSVRDLASIFEFKKIWETKSAPVTPAATSTPITFDYDEPLSKSKYTRDVFPSPSVGEIHKKVKPDVQKEQESNIKKSKEVTSISSSTSMLNTKDDKNLKSLQNLKQRFSSEIHLSSNVTKTQHKYKDSNNFSETSSQTKTNIGVSDGGPLERMKRIKSESQFNSKFIVKDIQVTTDVTRTENSKVSIQEGVTTNYKSVLKSAEKEVKPKAVESQPSVVLKSAEKEVKPKAVESQPSAVQTPEKVKIETKEQKPDHSSSIQNTEKTDETQSEQKTSYSKEMSLRSLERRASVTKIKTMYERQSSVPKIETTQKDTPPNQIQYSNSVGSLKTQVTNSSSKETKITSLSTMSQESSNKISEKDDAKFEFKSKEVVESSEDVSHKVTTTSKKKTKIEELVESFVKSEGLSQYLEEHPDKNISPLNNTESKNFKYEEKEEKIETSSFQELKKVSKKVSTSMSSGKDKTSEEVNNTTLVVRSGSRELRPDELKYFQSMTTLNTNNQSQMRERSNSIDTSSPTSTLPKNNFSRSKMRSSSRQFRDLHSDELKYFGNKINDRHSKKLLPSSAEVTLRQEVLERALLASSLGENEREE